MCVLGTRAGHDVHNMLERILLQHVLQGLRGKRPYAARHLAAAAGFLRGGRGNAAFHSAYDAGQRYFGGRNAKRIPARNAPAAAHNLGNMQGMQYLACEFFRDMGMCGQLGSGQRVEIVLVLKKADQQLQGIAGGSGNAHIFSQGFLVVCLCVTHEWVTMFVPFIPYYYTLIEAVKRLPVYSQIPWRETVRQ